MIAMTVGELLTYLKALPKETTFPIGLGTPFIINNVTNQFIFRPKMDQNAEQMAERIEELLGKTLVSATGAQSIFRREDCYAYFGLDEETPITPMNIVFLTILRSMAPADKEITVSLVNPETNEATDLSTKFKVPSVWWETLSKRHQGILAMEYLTNQVLGGIRFTETPNINISEETKDEETQTDGTEETNTETPTTETDETVSGEEGVEENNEHHEVNESENPESDPPTGNIGVITTGDSVEDEKVENEYKPEDLLPDSAETSPSAPVEPTSTLTESHPEETA